MSVLSSAHENRAKTEERRRLEVLKRLRWAGDAGVIEADLGKRLGWPTGTGAVLRELAEREEAHQRGDRWYYGQGSDDHEPPEESPASTSVDLEAEVLRQLGTSKRSPVTLGMCISSATIDQVVRAVQRLVDRGELERVGDAVRRVRRPEPARMEVEEIAGATVTLPDGTERCVTLQAGEEFTPSSTDQVAAALAQHPDGTTVRALAEDTGLRAATVRNSLQTLCAQQRARHNGLRAKTSRYFPAAPSTSSAEVRSSPVAPSTAVGQPDPAREVSDVVAPPASAGTAPAEATAEPPAFHSGGLVRAGSQLGKTIRGPDAPPDEESLEDLGRRGLTVRTENCLRAAELMTAGEIRALSDRELLAIRNMGRKQLEEIRHLLEHGKTDPPSRPVTITMSADVASLKAEVKRPPVRSVPLVEHLAAVAAGSWVAGLRSSARNRLSTHDVAALEQSIRTAIAEALAT